MAVGEKRVRRAPHVVDSKFQRLFDESEANAIESRLDLELMELIKGQVTANAATNA
jgi:hypothetical protein